MTCRILLHILCLSLCTSLQPSPDSSLVTLSIEEPIRWFGFPKYPEIVPSWADFVRSQGILGRECSEEGKSASRYPCGPELVCRKGICGECRADKECPEQYLCEIRRSGHSLCAPRNLKTHFRWSRELICTVLIVITAALCAVAGMGGGGVYVPLFLLVNGLQAREAVPLSQTLILGGSLVNYMIFCGEKHPSIERKSKIDYVIVMMLQPGLAAGVSVGVLVHMVTPQWLIVLMLLVTLMLAFEKTLWKGLKQWKEESETQIHQNSVENPKKKFSENLMIRFRNFRENFTANREPLFLIVGCWTLFLVINLMVAPRCSPRYWGQFAVLLLGCIFFTYLGGRLLKYSKKCEGHTDPFSQRLSAMVNQSSGIDWHDFRSMWFFPLISVVAGILGGLLGIGGGIIMAPLLLELGLAPEANQATTALFVLLSSSLATIQFIVLGKEMPEYVAWFTFWAVLATFVGQILIEAVINVYKRTSVIVLSIAAVIGSSAVLMLWTGAAGIIEDMRNGAYLGFMPHRLCG